MKKLFKGVRLANEPVTDVTTPQTLFSYKLRGLKFRDEIALKSSLLSPQLIPEHINQTIFKCLVDCSNQQLLSDFKLFQSSVTLEDRKALMFALYISSMGNDTQIINNCVKCGNKIDTVVMLSNFVKEEFYKGAPGEVLQLKKQIELPLSKAKVYLKYPTILDEVNITKYLNDNSNDELFYFLLRIDSFEVFRVDENNNLDMNNYDKYDDIESKILFSKDLLLKDKKYIIDEYSKLFLDTYFEINGEYDCPKCGGKNSFYKDIMNEFFLLFQ